MAQYLLEQEPDDPEAGTVLFIASLDEDEQQVAQCADWLLKQHQDCDNTPSQFLCARICIALKAWEQAIRYAKRVHEHAPRHIEALQYLCAALVNSGAREEAFHYYQKMEEVDSESPLTVRMRGFFANFKT